MGNVCCQQVSNAPTILDTPQRKFEFQHCALPEITNKNVAFRLGLLEKQNLITVKENLGKELPPMKEKTKQFVYAGEWLNEKPEGHGKIYFKNGQYFQGQFFEGAAKGKGIFIYQNGSYFHGNIENNLASGHGDYICQQFEFRGHWQASRPKNGTFKLANNTTIDLQEPKYGTINWVDGRIYKGEIKELNPHGQGRITFPNKNLYDGNWNEGLMHGYGTFEWADGSKYIGQYSKGIKQGTGIFTYKNGIVYQGQWKNGKHEGKGKLLHESKTIYEGHFKNGIPDPNYIQQQIHGQPHLDQPIEQNPRSRVYMINTDIKQPEIASLKDLNESSKHHPTHTTELKKSQINTQHIQLNNVEAIQTSHPVSHQSAI